MTEMNNGMQNQETQYSPCSNPVPLQDTFDQPDIDNNKTVSGLAYLIFFLPLIVCPESQYGRFHANQALLLFIAAIGGNIILGIIPVIGWMLMPIYNLGILVLLVIGLINGLNGKVKRLPLFGKYNLLK